MQLASLLGVSSRVSGGVIRSTSHRGLLAATVPRSAPTRGVRTIVRPYVDDKADSGRPELSEISSVEQCPSIPSVWPLLAKKYGDLVALNDHHFGSEGVKLTFSQLDAAIKDFSSGLVEVGGVTAGDHVALFSENSHRWFIADQAIQSLGAVDCVRGG